MNSPQANADQIAYWNGPAGQRWREQQQAQDLLFTPITAALIERAAPVPGECVLDIGCGCGETTLELAARVVPDGGVTGVDVSAPMVERARERAGALLDGPAARFLLADASLHDFEPHRADLVCSRFGVMFFDDPLRAFGNIRRGMRRGARLVFVCWRAARENPWLMLPLQEAYRHVPKLPQPGPEDPGPFAFAEDARVRRILAGAGFASIAIEAVDASLDLAGGRGLDAAVELACVLGPTHRALDGQPQATQDAAAASIRVALARFLEGDRVALAAATWMVTAVNP